jgi:hypothetical protein
MACNASLTSVVILSAWAFASAKFGKPPKVCGPRRSLKLVIWNASSPHYYARALAALKGERLWRMQVGEAGQSRHWC